MLTKPTTTSNPHPCGNPLCTATQGADRVCSVCRSARYCSKSCQKADWKKHKPLCVLKKVDRTTKAKAKPEPRATLTPITTAELLKLAAAQQDQHGSYEPDGTCSICLDQVKPADSLLLGCGHQLHRTCMSQLRSCCANDLCPMCREPLPPSAERYRDEAILMMIRGERADPNVDHGHDEPSAGAEMVLLAIMSPATVVVPNQKAAAQCYAEAKTLLVQALAEEPTHVESLLTLGAVLGRMNDTGGAISALEQAAASDPSRSDVHYKLGVAKSNLQDALGACACFKRAIALDPKNERGGHCDLYSHLSSAFEMAGDLKSARVAFGCAEHLRQGARRQIHTINFQIDDPNYPEEPSSYVPLDDPREALQYMHNKDELVIQSKTVKLIIDYPMRSPYEEIIASASGDGFTRAELTMIIAGRYQAVYEEEARTSSVGLKSHSSSGMFSLNRHATNGRYGIYGHEICDLLLHSVHHNKLTNEIRLGIDS